MSIKSVCSSCFEDEDLRAWIRKANGPRGCDACGGFDSPTRKLKDICRHIQSCLENYWGYAVEQLPHESAEGGYIGRTWTTYEILDEEVGLSLPRDGNRHLFYALIGKLTDELWCEYNWLTLDDDVALRTSWESFCEIVKHKRRFFFHTNGTDDHDSYTPISLLNAIAIIGESNGLIRELAPGTKLWRARADIPRYHRVIPADFGPPPNALQSNRMNPAGIPMLYLASSAQTARKEIRAKEARIGQWQVLHPLRILDLRRLPDVPGIFSSTERNYRLTLCFLHHFADDIMTPVARDDRVHVDYLPSQVVTEFVRDYSFDGGKIDGIAYRSSICRKGWNVALFAGPADLGLEAPERGQPLSPCLRFTKSIRIRLSSSG